MGEDLRVVVGGVGRHDLKVRKGDTPGPWDFIVNAARLTPGRP